MTQNSTAAGHTTGLQRKSNSWLSRHPAALLGCAFVAVPVLLDSVLGIAYADNSAGTGVVASPLASEIVSFNARRLNLGGRLGPIGSDSGSFDSSARTTLNFGFDVRPGLKILESARERKSSPSRGDRLLPYNLTASDLDKLAAPSSLSAAPSQTSAGSTPAPVPAPSPTPAAAPASGGGDAHHESFTLGGQMFLSNAAAAPMTTSASAGLNMASDASANPSAPGFLGEDAAHEAYNQNLAYTGNNVSLTASIAKIGRNFADDGLYTPTLGGTDQTNDATASGLMNRRGQDEQTMALSLGAAQRTGQFTFNMDDLTDKVNDHRTNLQTLGYTWGSLSKTQFSFLSSSSRDLIGHSHNDNQAFALNQALGKTLSLQMGHVIQSQGVAGALTSTTDNLHMALSPDKRMGLGGDFIEKIASDTFGGSDRAMNFNLHRTMGGMTLGLLYGDEQRKSVGSLGGTASLASINTIGYNATKQISKVFSVDTNWQTVHDTSQSKGRRHLATETTHFNYNPFKSVTLLDQYTTNSGINNRLMSANYALPIKALAPLGFGAVTVSATSTQTSGINCEMNQASTQTQKLALDTTLPRRVGLAGLLPSFLGGDTTVHVEFGTARIDDFKNSSGQLSHGENANVQGMKFGGSLAFWKSSHWGYGYALQTPTNTGASKLPDAYEYDFSAPISKLTMTVYDHDQIDQGGGNYKHATDRHLSLGGALTSTLNLTFDTGESRDYTLSNPSHTHMMGIHLSGKHGAMQNLDFKLQRQLESETHNGRNNQTIYGLNFNLPKTDTHHLSLNCAVTDNKYINRPASTGKMTATVGFDFAQQF